MKVLIIAAAGSVAKDTINNKPKQLLEIKGETVLDRLLRQFKPHMDKVWIVTWKPELIKLYPSRIFLCCTKFSVETYHNTRHLWGDRTLFVPGDAVFQEESAKLIHNYRGDFCGFGTGAEPLGFSFSDKSHTRVENALQKALESARTGKHLPANYKLRFGNMWVFMRAYCGIPLHKHDWGANGVDKGVFTYLNDRSTDIDKAEYYEEIKTWF